MKAKEIQELIDFIAKSGLDEVNIETESFKIAVKRNHLTTKTEQVVVQQPVQAIPQIVNQDPVQVVTNHIPETNQTETPQAESASAKNLVEVKSPMIGTFYRSANPDSPAFVNVGDDIKEGQVVCIIEAMKLFNEIESEVSGKIVKVLVDNASPVEYDQPLFLVEPNS